MTDKTSKEYYKAIGRAIYDEIHRVPDHDEDFDYEEELSVIARDYPENFDTRKEELRKEKLEEFDLFLKNKNALIGEISNITPELVEKTVIQIDTIDSKIIEIIEWFIQWDIDKTDDMKSFKTYKSLNENFPTSDSSHKNVKTPQKNITKEDAKSLLKKLEDPNYTAIDEEEKHFKNRSFKTYRSIYINKRNREYYKEAFKILRDRGDLSHEEFLSMTKCPSKWYKPLYIGSFTHHCENIKGRFFEKCKERKFKNNSELRRKNSKETYQAFTLR